MNELRWILLVAGVILIAAVYLWGMRARGRATGRQAETLREAVEPASIASSPVETYEASARDFERMENDDADADERYARPAVSRRIEPDLSLDDVEPDYVPPAPPRTSERRTPGLGATPVTPAPVTTAARREPTLGPARETPQTPNRVEQSAEAEPAPAAAPPRRPAQKIIAIRVSATPPARFEGPQLLEALKSEGLVFGKYEIFHHLNSDGRPVFSAASLREPGTFDLEEMSSTSYPGIALFSVLPGPVPPTEAFDQMLFTARALATLLQGALADERGVPLTTLRVGKLREDVVEFERGLSGGGPAG